MFGQEAKKFRSVWDCVEFEAHPGKVIQSAVGYVFLDYVSYLAWR